MNFLAIDSGTTNTKLFVFDSHLHIKEESSFPTGISYPKPELVEQNAEDWFLAVLNGARKLKNKKAVGGISGSFQGGTFVPLDKHLNPLRPAITWLDNRGKEIAKKLIVEYGQDYFYKKTGHKVAGWWPLTVLKWLKKYEPQVWKKIARISFVADYLNFKLTGNFFLDPTSAAMTSLFNIRELKWDKELLNMAGLTEAMLPQVIGSYQIGGELKKQGASLLSLTEGVPVFAGGHDQYCASLGAGAMGKETALISCGTAWIFLVTTKNIVLDPAHQLSPGPHLFPEQYGLMGTAGNGGAMFDWGLRNLKESKISFSGKPSEVTISPYFSEGNGAILNLDLSTNSSDVLLAILEAPCFQVREIIDSTKSILGNERVNELVMTGGGAKNRLLTQLLADITGLKVTVPEVKEAAGRGAAILSMVRNDISLLKTFSPPGKTYTPEKEIFKLYNSKYSKFSQFKKENCN